MKAMAMSARHESGTGDRTGVGAAVATGRPLAALGALGQLRRGILGTLLADAGVVHADGFEALPRGDVREAPEEESACVGQVPAVAKQGAFQLP